VKSLQQIITILLSSGLAIVAIPASPSASAQISQERLNLELAQMDLIAQCDANLNWIGDNPADNDAEEVLASCDRVMLDIQNNCNENAEFTTCSDERIEGYLITRGVLS
jgi:hypothetical protein